jgi:protein with PEP-CTERM/exosortase system signal
MKFHMKVNRISPKRLTAFCAVLRKKLKAA